MLKDEVYNLLEEFKRKLIKKVNTTFFMLPPITFNPVAVTKVTENFDSKTTHLSKEIGRTNYTIILRKLYESRIGMHSNYMLSETDLGLFTFNIDTIWTFVCGIFSLSGLGGTIFSIVSIVQCIRGVTGIVPVLILIPSSIIAIILAVLFFKKDQKRKKILLENNPLDKAKGDFEKLVHEVYAEMDLERHGFTLTKHVIEKKDIEDIQKWSSNLQSNLSIYVPFFNTFYQLGSDSGKSFSASDVEDVYKNKGEWEYFKLVHENEKEYLKELSEFMSH